jgi:hypothetical protein
MTPEELQFNLASNPRNMLQLTNEERSSLLLLLSPYSSEGFSQQQFEWLSNWFLVVPENEITSIEVFNQKPRSIKVGYQTTLDDRKVVRAAILLDQGNYPRHELPCESWTIVKLSDSDFPHITSINPN